MPTLGVLLRCHRRARSLDIVLSELERYRTLGLNVCISSWEDRITPEVAAVLDRHSAPGLIRTPSEFPLLDTSEHWQTAQNCQLDILEYLAEPDFCFMVDDDRWPEPTSFSRELVEAVKDEDTLMWFFRSVFFWDSPTQINTNRNHYSALFWRHTAGARFSNRRLINVPDAIHDDAVISGRVRDFKTPMLDYGAYDAAERATVYKAFTAAGRDDGWTQSLIQPPNLVSFPDSSYGPWTDLWTTHA